MCKKKVDNTVYLVKDGHVAADKTVSHNLGNSSSLVLNVCNAFQMVTEYRNMMAISILMVHKSVSVKVLVLL